MATGAGAETAGEDPGKTAPEPKFKGLKSMLEIPESQWPTYSNFGFDVTYSDEASMARVGLLKTPHGNIETPAFVFCATKAAVRGVTMETMKQCKTQIILSNTYHLLVQPGPEAIKRMGGLQRCTRWGGPMLTDSGGYQIFSMGFGSVADEIKGRRGTEGGDGLGPSLLSIGEKGARFKSYQNGAIHKLTPEISVQIQRSLGADLILVLDECTPFHVDKAYTQDSMRRSHRWAMRSLAEFIKGDDGSQALYGIIQGGTYEDLREESTSFCNNNPFFGVAVGGSLGADKQTMYDTVKSTMSNIRRDRPVHLLGVGGVSDVFFGVRQGIDTFDCVHPTRLGRHGGALVKAGHWCAGNAGVAKKEHINLDKGRFSDDHRVIDENCGCPTCKGGYTRAYLHHLGKAKEIVRTCLLVAHNVWYMNSLFEDIRAAIPKGTLEAVEKEYLPEGLRPSQRTAMTLS
ncbi:unnamed protein product [Chrysoparadoxa australica]